MTVGGELTVDRAAQVKVADDGGRAQVKDLLDGLLKLRIGDRAGAEGLDEHAHGMRHADGVGELHLALRRKTGSHDVLGDPARGVGGGAVHLRRVLAGEAAAAVRGAAAVGIDDDLAACQTAVALRAADDKTAGRVDINFRFTVEQARGDGGLDDQLDHIAADGLQLRLGRVLRGDDHGVDALGLAGLVVFDRDLRLAVGTQIVHKTLLANLGQALGHLVRE